MGEALRIKKKLEGDINELEIVLDHSNKANSEAQKSIKRYQGQVREAECAMRRPPVSGRRWLRRPALLRDVLPPLLVRWRRQDPSSTLLREARGRLRLSLLRPVLLSMK